MTLFLRQELTLFWDPLVYSLEAMKIADKRLVSLASSDGTLHMLQPIQERFDFELDIFVWCKYYDKGIIHLFVSLWYRSANFKEPQCK